ncbi:MAG: 5-carboxymethyl-2-hydroxymuconate Delta-isomerase [Elstera sp.]
MPQIRLEGSPSLLAALDLSPMLNAIHDTVVAIAGAKHADCKTLVRDARADHINLGDGTDTMLHAEIRLMPGRELATKQALGAAVAEILEAAAKPHLNGRSLQATVEIVEFLRETYAKRVVSA